MRSDFITEYQQKQSVMSSESKMAGRGDTRPGMDAARRVAAGQGFAVDETGELFALYDEATDKVGVFELAGWEGAFSEDVDIYGHQVWSASRSELVDQAK